MTDRKAVFITGAASGIGLGTAKRFAKEGWFVGLADINAAGLKSALDAIGPPNGATYLLDVRDSAAWTDALSVFAAASGGRLDALINNAGVATYGYLEDQSDDEVARQLDVNVKGMIAGARAAVPYLKKTPGAQLVNVASAAAFYGAPKMSVYCASKFAIRGLSEALDIEFARFGVGVKCIMPWFVETPILNAGAQATNEKMSDMLRDAGVEVYSVEEAAGVIWDSLASKKLKHIVGRRGRELSVMARFVPWLMRRQLKASNAAGDALGA
ncbi:MAG TPA: SDR family oxidoreductase [Rhizomicrobium sp.]|jgi:NAD(P)-dependent dehydrogenase (short-subunit alcohol dehydrogenase family)|nr:SDR family oxidoreductase [Rhizomicrobium sp.]